VINASAKEPRNQRLAQRLDGNAAERVRGEWPDQLPIYLRTAAQVRVSRGRFDQTWSKRLTLLKWVITGEAAIRINGRRFPFGPGEVAIHVATMPHAFWAVAPESEMCWFSIDGPLAEPFVQLLGLRPGVFPYGAAPVERIGEMIRSLDDQTRPGRLRSSLLAIAALHEAAATIPVAQAPSLVRQVRHLIEEGLADPDLSAKGIATRLNYNRGALSRTFHRQTGSTIMESITHSRLQEAEMLLEQTDDRVCDIARRCGFRDVSYFTRWVKKHTGRLPSHLRASE
jgi:AraC-like DNA-binding protein